MQWKTLVAEPWYVDRVDIVGERVSVAGWSMPVDLSHVPADGWFTINGRRFDAIRYPLPRGDVGEVFWQREGAANSGFECTIEHMADPYPGGESWRQAVERVAGFLEGLRHGRVLVIGHGATRLALEVTANRRRLEDLVDAPFVWQPGWEYVLTR